jgi:hypothetical protein
MDWPIVAVTTIDDLKEHNTYYITAAFGYKFPPLYIYIYLYSCCWWFRLLKETLKSINTYLSKKTGT